MARTSRPCRDHSRTSQSPRWTARDRVRWGPLLPYVLKFAWLAGGFLVSYIALAEAAKYAVPSVARWLAVELSAGIVRFTAYGLLLAAVYRLKASSP